MIWLLTTAHAHDPFGELASAPLLVDGELVGVWSSSGLVLREDDRWVRRCVEGLPTYNAYVAVRGADGLRIWLGDTRGLTRIVDGGCASERGPELGPVGAFVVWSGHGLLALPTLESANVFLSSDAGDTFTPLPLPAPSRLTSAAVDPLGALVLGGTSAGLPVLWHTTDGVSFVSVPPPDPLAAALEVAPGDDRGVLVAGYRLDGTTSVTLVDPSGGATPLAELPLPASGLACLGSDCYAGQSQLALLRFDGLGPPILVEDGPPACLVRDGDRLWGCTQRASDQLLAWTVDGATWTGEVATTEVEERDCGLVDFCNLPPPSTDDASPAETGAVVLEERGCGCELGGGGGGAALLLTAWSTTGRRRRRAAGA